MPEEIVSLEVKFKPWEIGKYNAYLRLFTIDNPEMIIIIDLMGEAYYEIVILEGLELTDIKYNFKNDKRESVSKSQRSSKPNSAITGAPVIS